MIRHKIGEGLKDAFILIFIGIILPILFSIGVVSIDIDILSSVREGVAVGLLFIVSILIVAFLYTIFVAPVKMYEELGGFVEKPLVLIPEPHPDVLDGVTQYARAVRVDNPTAFDVDNCMLRLTSAVRINDNGAILRREEVLTWSQREKSERNGGIGESKIVYGQNYRLCNIAVLNPLDEINPGFFTLGSGPKQYFQNGEYKLAIQVTGKWKGHNMKYTQEMILYTNGIDLLLDGR